MKSFTTKVLVSVFIASISAIASASAYDGIYQPIGKGVDTVITSAHYQPEGHLLVLELEYQACDTVTHTLTINDICQFTDPMRCSARIRSYDSVDPSCSKTISEIFTYPLANSFDRVVLSISTYAGDKTEVFIDRN